MTAVPDSAHEDPGYELIDAGQGRRLERFGSHVIDRPAPGADFAAGAPERWEEADLSWDPDGGWLAEGGPTDGNRGEIQPWPVAVDGLTLELRPTSSGGVGLYPEHRANVGWLGSRVAERLGRPGPPQVLNLFAHTGLVTLAAARAGAAVTHVDGARGVVAWARRNADLSGLADRPIRWLVDDVTTFVAREARRGRRYDGIVLDPPSFGHARGRRWRLADQLPDLLAACRAVATDDAFVLLTAHTAGLDGEDLADAVRAAFPETGAPVEGSELRLAATSGVHLDLGWTVRLAG
jgi:23S rRNA (cytosine1962-C5)-methyltransferase